MAKLRSSSFWVAAGIFLSRIAGLLREKVLAHYLGASLASDIFRAALRIPNILQNLLGEGVLSASFIPVYAGLLEKKEQAKARKLAYAVGSSLFALTSALVALGMLSSPCLVNLITPGFSAEAQKKSEELVRMFFPAMGLLVMSAWCLGVLNSHRKFFLSYVAPVFWNLAIMASLLIFNKDKNMLELASIAGWGLVAGSLLQFLIQIPFVLSLLKSRSKTRDSCKVELKTVYKNFLPALSTRGVLQISSYLDTVLASLLPLGTLSILSYSTTLFMLPISLFGMSISAAELPELSRLQARDNGRSQTQTLTTLQSRLQHSQESLSFFISLSFFAFFFLGSSIISLLFQGGSFSSTDRLRVWVVLATMSLGLFSATSSRLLSSSFFAFGDTQTPFHGAIFRIGFSVVLSIFFSFFLFPKLGVQDSFLAIGLALSTFLASAFEYQLLKRWLLRKHSLKAPDIFYSRQMFAAGFSGLLSFFLTTLAYIKWPFPSRIEEIWIHLASLIVFGSLWVSFALLFKIPQMRDFKSRLLKK